MHSSKFHNWVNQIKQLSHSQSLFTLFQPSQLLVYINLQTCIWNANGFSTVNFAFTYIYRWMTKFPTLWQIKPLIRKGLRTWMRNARRTKLDPSIISDSIEMSPAYLWACEWMKMTKYTPKSVYPTRTSYSRCSENIANIKRKNYCQSALIQCVSPSAGDRPAAFPLEYWMRHANCVDMRNDSKRNCISSLPTQICSIINVPYPI